MGDADIDMGGIDPGRPPLPYGIPYPPALPDKIRWQDGEDEIDPNWFVHAKYFGARDNKAGDGFDTRSCHPNLKGKGNFTGNWEVDYWLGRPSEVQWSRVISKWGLQVLDAAGFLNLNLGLPNASADPQGRYFSKRPEALKDEALHPVFRRDMWKGILYEHEWSAIRPAFLLASALLDDPTTMCLFYAVATPTCYEWIRDPTMQFCTRLRVPNCLTEAQQASVFQKICDMRQHTYFYWESPSRLVGYGAAALTDATRPINDIRSLWASRIGFARSHCSTLMSWQKQTSTKDHFDSIQCVLNAAGVPASHVPEDFADDLNSPALRSYFLFANTIVHEFAHAFAFAYFETIVDPSIPCEPFVGDERASELGFATSRHIFGGVAHASNFGPPAGAPLNILHEIADLAPFGITFKDKWRAWAEPGTQGERQHVLEEGKDADFAEPVRSYPLPQNQVYDYFTDEMWKTKVPRHGLEALKFVKMPEWAAVEMPGPNPQRPWIKSTLR